MLTFNKYYVFAKDTDINYDETKLTCNRQESEQEQTRQKLLTAARQAGGIDEDAL